MERGLEHLQSIVSGSGTSKSVSTAPIQTKNDAKFEATKHLLLTVLQLESAAIVLEEYIKVICNVESSRTSIVEKSQHLKKYIVPMISYAAKSLDKISKSLLSIPSINYVHKRMEVKRKSEVVNDSNSRKSPDLQLVYDYSAHKYRKKRGDTNKITPPKKKLRVLSCHGAALSTDAIKLPEPADGHEYRRPEVAKILSPYKRGSKKIGLVMQRMIDLKYVPCGIHTLHCLASAINGD